MSDAPERVGVKRTNGYERNWWGVLTHVSDEDAVEYIRADIAGKEIDRLTRELAEARDKALEEAAKVARTWLEDWGCDLQHTADEYREAMRTGRFANRRIDAGPAKLYASQFQERADAVYDCGKQVHEAIRALKEKP